MSTQIMRFLIPLLREPAVDHRLLLGISSGDVLCFALECLRDALGEHETDGDWLGMNGLPLPSTVGGHAIPPFFQGS